MNLLLLLSALLSALTGVGQSVRAPQVAAAIAQDAVIAERAAAERKSVAQRPAAGPPSLAAVAFVALIRQAVAPREPLYAGRRRE